MQQTSLNQIRLDETMLPSRSQPHFPTHPILNTGCTHPHASSTKAHELSSTEKGSQFRAASRRNQIENIKKTIRFNWNVELTIEYLKSIQYQTVDSQQILIQAIDNHNLEYLVDLIVSADPLFKSAVLSQSYRLLALVEAKFEQPSSILLLGNLCALYSEFIEASQSKKMLVRLMESMVRMKSNLKCVEICSWALTQICRQPYLLQEDQVLECLPGLCSLLWQVFSKQSPKQVCTHLCRLVSQFSTVVQFPEDFLECIVAVYPSRSVDRLNMYLAIQSQVKIARFSENSKLRISILEYLVWLHQRVWDKLPKSKTSLYSLVCLLIQKSQQDVGLQVCGPKFSSLLAPYQYADKSYYKMLHQLLVKLSCLNPNFLQQLRSSALLQNLVSDISDPNAEVGYLCLQNVAIIVEHLLSTGDIEMVEWLLALGLEGQVEHFLSDLADSHMAKLAEKLLDMIRIE